MAIKRLNYKSTSSQLRKVSGQKLLSQLRDSLRNPILTSDQRIILQAEIDRINAWIEGRLENPLDTASFSKEEVEIIEEAFTKENAVTQGVIDSTLRPGKAHVVDLKELLSVDAKTG